MKDITGQKFNRLTAIRHVGKNRWGQYLWLFKCNCGNYITTLGKQVRTGSTSSCGCFKREIARVRATSHKMSNTRFYKIWLGMVKRCTNKKCKAFYQYGGRGITIEWKNFESFRNDMYKPYLEHVKNFGEKQTSIDRTDNGGNYCKQNCRWATRLEQGNNTRNTRLISFNGVNKTLTDWSMETGINRNVLNFRLWRGWSVERALTQPTRKSPRYE